MRRARRTDGRNYPLHSVSASNAGSDSHSSPFTRKKRAPAAPSRFHQAGHARARASIIARKIAADGACAHSVLLRNVVGVVHQPHEVPHRGDVAPEGRPLDAAAVARLSALPFYNARLRTTCVPTRVTAGHADNALPQLASAIVNCRLLPGETSAHVEQVLRGVIADPQVSVKAISSMTTTAPTLPPAKLLGIIEKVTSRFWPGVPVLPTMSAGATDGRFLRAAGIPTYGVSGLFHEVDDNRAHGRDERLAVRSFVEGQAFTYALLQALVAN